MPKRLDIKSILVLGAGPIIIGQGCEFDYSGVQACRALKEEGYRIILVNSNPATIMTDPDFSDATYIEPIHWQEVTKIIELERPDALLPTMGGQTALNCAMDLVRRGILAQYNVELIGANAEAIEKAEDRERFRLAMKEIHLDVPRAATVGNLDAAYQIQAALGFPVVIRPSFTLGGKGGGIAYNMHEFETICTQGIMLSPIHTILIEESLLGWKEFELEVVRDSKDNCIIVCAIENIDPMGVHTGDSMTVAPALTLRDKEYQVMRNSAIAILRKIGVDTGGSNVQFAVHPKTGRMVVIEMNPRVSRSSALASKATGFPIAKVAAKLAVGFTLNELGNDITGGCIPASFEPTIDYVVTKIPRFHFDKFPGADQGLTTQMKSVGEVMALGRTFQESFQKALCGLEIGLNGLSPRINVGMDQADAIKLLENKLTVSSFDRMLYVADAFRYGMSLEKINILTSIDPWFLDQVRDLIATETEIQASKVNSISSQKLFDLKQKGFSDNRLAELLNVQEQDIRGLRQSLNIRPVFKRVDSCAAEFPVSSAYLYATYETSCEANPSDAKKIIVLGGGPNRIGQGIEFDYCCVHAVMAFREIGFEVIMINCNPETVSTDYDISDRLYFESLNIETVLEIVHLENPLGVIVQYGGQTPLKLVKALEKAGVKILGTQADAIDCAENRQRFHKLITQLGLKQAKCETACSVDEGRKHATKLGFPIVVRPSYVLGGQAMRIVENEEELITYFKHAVKVSHDCPVLLDKFIENAIEVDVDAISDGNEVFIGGILEHIELAGIHSGDSTCSLPCHSLSSDIQTIIREQVTCLALALKVIGPLNVQFAIQKNDIYVIEVNPRVSRTMPFVSKAIGLPLAKIAALCMVGKTLREQGVMGHPMPNYFSVKSPVFVFDRFLGTDIKLGPEMKSTGEVMGVGTSFEEALFKSQKAAGMVSSADDVSSSLKVRSLQALHNKERVLICVD